MDIDNCLHLAIYKNLLFFKISFQRFLCLPLIRLSHYFVNNIGVIKDCRLLSQNCHSFHGSLYTTFLIQIINMKTKMPHIPCHTLSFVNNWEKRETPDESVWPQLIIRGGLPKIHFNHIYVWGILFARKKKKFTEDKGCACVYRHVCDLMIEEL